VAQRFQRCDKSSASIQAPQGANALTQPLQIPLTPTTPPGVCFPFPQKSDPGVPQIVVCPEDT